MSEKNQSRHTISRTYIEEETLKHFNDIAKIAHYVQEDWDSSNLYWRIRMVTKMNTLTEAFSQSLYKWNNFNGWYGDDIQNFYDTNPLPLKKKFSTKDADLHHSAITQTLILNEALEAFVLCCRDYCQHKPGSLFGGIRLIMDMKYTVLAVIKLLDEAAFRSGSWYQNSLEKTENGGTGSDNGNTKREHNNQKSIAKIN